MLKPSRFSPAHAVIGALLAAAGLTTSCSDDSGEPGVAGIATGGAGAVAAAPAAGGTAAFPGTGSVAATGNVAFGGTAAVGNAAGTGNTAGSGNTPGSGNTAGTGNTGAVPSGGSSGSNVGGSGNTGSGTCTDEPPPNGDTCAHAVEWGWCGQDWMDGACARSCGLCSGGGTSGGGTSGGGTSGGGTSGGGTSGSGGTSNVGGVTGNCNGWASRYWDCCKPHCAWSANTNDPVTTCSSSGSPVSEDTQSACNGGSAYMCHSMAPWSASGNLSYGYAAVPNNGDVCGRCYQLAFNGTSHNNPNDPGSKLLSGKQMVVQVTNVGGDVGSGQFDLLIPGGGVGAFNACSQQLGVSDLGAQYGGFRTQCSGTHAQIKSCVKSKCQTAFARFPDLLAGCNWYVDWLEAADNPAFKYMPVACPSALTSRSGAAGKSPAGGCG